MGKLKKAEDLDWGNPIVTLITDIIGECGPDGTEGDDHWVLSALHIGPDYLVPKGTLPWNSSSDGSRGASASDRG